ncbi:tumor necrosis factor receptor superfamily member 9a [Cololabis saira]|uniref:tumor necrosis factor receptor superfamily member 9a n=1 Tax=Cololabis saira TaxID=129043 RepID=UPI002AD4F3CA|nr:tumor necrosis factor receptor superfamily member 9a [Cololabis saira]
MAAIFCLMGLALLTQGCWGSLGQTDIGCKRWHQKGADVCCEECYPGNRLIKECGPDPRTLCEPCDPGYYTLKPKAYSCDRCTQCVGAQVHLEDCTATKDTTCGCRDGLACGNDQCSFCVEKCAKGYEPTDDRSCRPCPQGTFSDKSQKNCQPWSTRCPHPNQRIVAKGNASSDIQCITEGSVINPRPDDANQTGPLVLILIIAMTTFCITITIFIIIVAVKHNQRRKRKIVKPLPPTESPTDDPRTLIAIECSFHEAQQEQGSTSTESLISNGSSKLVIA